MTDTDRLAALLPRSAWPDTYTAPEAKAWIAAMDAAEGALFAAGLIDEWGRTLDPPVIAAKVAFTADEIDAALKTIRGEVTYEEATIMVAAGAAASALRTGGRIVPLEANHA